MHALETPTPPSPDLGKRPASAQRAWRGWRSWVLAGAMLAVAGCASVPDPSNEVERQIYEEANDPLEPLNRTLFDFNLFLDRIIVRPLATMYEGVLPRPVRQGVRNFLNNLRSPIILANDLLQGEWERAETTLTRFGINTTAGIGGVMDPATDWGYPFHNEDFGQTLAVQDIGEGPYLYIPLLGPAPPRDLAGFFVDFLFDPLTYIDGSYSTARFAVNGVDTRARNLGTLEQIEKGSIDFYATIRSLYRQNRAFAIANGRDGDESAPPSPGFLSPKQPPGGSP